MVFLVKRINRTDILFAVTYLKYLSMKVYKRTTMDNISAGVYFFEFTDG